MDPPKERHFNNPQDQNPYSQLIRNLISSIQAPKGLKPPLLKRLYYLLVHLSSDPQIFYPKAGPDSTFWDLEIGRHGVRVTFEDISILSDVLFKELSSMYKQFLSALQEMPASQDIGQGSLHLDIWETAEEIRLLLRCCLVMLNLLTSDQSRLLENGQVLLAILGELCSLKLVQRNKENTITFEKVSREYTYNDKDCATSLTEDIVASLHFMEPVDPRLTFLCSLLEVFADELLVHGQLREYLKLIDSLSSISRKLFMCSFSHDDIGNVVEVISNHFCLSFSDEQAFGNFPSRLFWPQGEDARAPELSLAASLILLLNHLMLSAPKFLLAHLISLVSEATIGVGSENIRPDIRLLDSYLSAFERSVILYVKHMSTLQMDDYPIGDDGSVLKFNKYGGNSQPSFESYIQPVTRKNVNNVISKLDNSWQSQLHDIFLSTKSDLVTSSIAYIMEGKHILDISFRGEIKSILTCITLKAFSYEVDNTSLHVSGDKSPQGIYLLASILKLMGCSLLQTIWCLMHHGNSGCLKTLEDFSSCKEYDSIVGILSCFEEFNVCLPVQRSLCGMMETHPAQHKASKLMLFHVAGLLSLSFGAGLEFLVKGCISTMMSLMNLFVFEDGNLDALRFYCRSDSLSSGLPPDNVPEAMVGQKSSAIVASKFQKIQTRYLSMPSISSDSIGHENGQVQTSTNSSIPNNTQFVVGIEEETEETSDGKIFLKCVLKNPGKPADFNDLADFIECKRGKDYSGWLKDRQRYRKWKCEKMAVLRWKKKKKTWKFMKGKRT